VLSGAVLTTIVLWLKTKYLAALKVWGYPLVALLMAVESTVLPVPSELIIPPAAHWAYTHEVPLKVWGIVLAGCFGSWLGATIMYWAARWAGRPLVLRYGRYVFIPPQKVEGAERWAARFGSTGIFISRLLDYKLFSLYTLLGSAVWCAVLCWVGVKAGQDEALMKGELHRVTLWVVGAFLVLGGLYYLFVHRHMKGPASSPK